MKPIQISKTNFKLNYVQAFNALPSNMKEGDKLSFYLYEDTVYAYPNAEHIFELGDITLSFINNNWRQL